MTVRQAPMLGMAAQAALLAALEATVGLSPLGWVVGIACAVVTNAAVARGLALADAEAIGPADLVTLIRATLAGGLAALVADSLLHQPAARTLVALAVVALVLDALDGWVARHTRTASPFGARFDGEVDAFLILVLSVYVAGSVGGWVLAIGLARYAFAVAGWGLPWLRGQLPPRYWRKVVAAVQGIVLTVAAANVAPGWLTYAALALALALLTESFARDVWWLWRYGRAGEDRRPQNRQPGRAVAPVVADALALVLVWFVLVAPNQAHVLGMPSTFLRIPVEALVVVGLAVALPSRARRVMAVVAGALLGLLTVVKLLDVAFFAALDRPFDLMSDRGYLRSAIALGTDLLGPLDTTLAVLAVVGVVVALLVCLPLSVDRLTALAARHRSRSVGVLAGLTTIWTGCAVLGLQTGAGEPVASVSTGRLAVGHVQAIAAGVRDLPRFEAAAAVDPFEDASDADLLTALRGKDVLFVFVESYGRVALEGLPSSPRVRAVLDAGTRRLGADGYSSRSAFLTSPTFGGLSWLAHATLQSGLWVDNQRRYDRLLSGDRLTLTRAFHRAGWRTVAVKPSNDAKWPEGRTFYRFDEIYDRWDLAYRGPRFGWAAMPDQYALWRLQRLELARRDRTPVMVEIDLASSHAPWTPVPPVVDWTSLDDGSVFYRLREQEEASGERWRHRETVQAAYARSIGYALRTVVSFLERYGDDELVLVLVGDHQPTTVVSGHDASRDVPITVIARDPAVIERISRWGWQDGMRPDPQAPVWRMDAFRDRFLDAYSPRLPTILARPTPPAPQP